jgi:hypothetical protein
MIDMLRRFLLHIAGRNPPRLGDIAGFGDAAARQAARYEADQRRRPPADDWLRQGDAGLPERTGPKWMPADAFQKGRSLMLVSFGA